MPINLTPSTTRSRETTVVKAQMEQFRRKADRLPDGSVSDFEYTSGPIMVPATSEERAIHDSVHADYQTRVNAGEWIFCDMRKHIKEINHFPVNVRAKYWHTAPTNQMPYLGIYPSVTEGIVTAASAVPHDLAAPDLFSDSFVVSNPTIDLDLVYQQAWSRVGEVGGTDILVTLGEAQETGRLIMDNARSIAKLIGLVVGFASKLQTSTTARLISKSIKMRERNRRKLPKYLRDLPSPDLMLTKDPFTGNFVNTVTGQRYIKYLDALDGVWDTMVRKETLKLLTNQSRDLWLMWRYGYRPLISDMESLGAALGELSVKAEHQFYIARAAKSNKVSRQRQQECYFSGYPGSLAVCNQMHHAREDARAAVVYKIDFGALETRLLGLDKFADAFWDLTPYSFVVDWLINISQAIASQQHRTGVHVVDSWVSLRYRKRDTVIARVKADIEALQGAPGREVHGTGHGISTISYDDTLRVSQQGVRPTAIPELRFKIDFPKAVDLVALADSAFRKGGSSVRWGRR